MSHNVNMTQAKAAYQNIDNSFNSGYHAFENDKPSESCPFDFGDANCDEWLAGWTLARDMS